MHIPDGFIDARTAVTAAVISAAGLAAALRRVRLTFPAHRVPLLGLTAAFVFAAQMLNFPVAGGTSGHMIGAVLAAVLVGPSAAAVVITAVLIIQCFLFADGGISALGANIFNMGLVAPFAGYVIYRAVLGRSSDLRRRLLAIAFAAWCSTVLAAICCAGELAFAGTVPWRAAFPAMAGVHMLIGAGEAVITALVFSAIQRTRPDLVASDRATAEPAYGTALALGLLIPAGLVLIVAPFACPWPDGLERVASRLGFAHKAAQPLLASPMPGYTFPILKSAVAATAVAGLVGTFVAFALAFVLARVLTPKPRNT